jgi:hypothetical protein
LLGDLPLQPFAHYFELRSTVAISREQASFRSTPAFLSASARSDPGGRFCASSSALSAAILHSDFIGGLRQSLVPIAIEVPNSFFSSDLGQHEWLDQVIVASSVAEQPDRTLTRSHNSVPPEVLFRTPIVMPVSVVRRWSGFVD